MEVFIFNNIILKHVEQVRNASTNKSYIHYALYLYSK